jgi:O-antigen/teichoic acid export membrane protein
MNKQNTVKEKKNENGVILNNSIFYSASLYLSKIIKTLGGVIVAKFMGPGLYGIKNMFHLFLMYESYSNLGTYEAMKREVPYFRASKDTEKADVILKSVFGFNMLLAILTGTILIITSLILKNTTVSRYYVYFTFFLGVLIITGKINSYFSNKFVADKNIILKSKVEVLYAFSNIVACVPLAYFYGLKGFFTGLLLADLIRITYTIIAVKHIPSIYISIPVIRKLIMIGLPKVISILLLTLLKSADRIVIIAMLTRAELGYFAIASVAIILIDLVPDAVDTTIFPRMMEKLGKTKDPEKIKIYLVEPVVLIAYMLPLLIAVLFFSIHIPVKYYLTQYVPSINVVKILSLGFFCTAVSSTAASVCYAFNKQKNLIYLILPVVALNFILNYIFIRFGWGINGVALGTSISYFIFGNILIWYALKQFRAKIREYVNLFILIFMPLVYAGVLLVCIDGYSGFSDPVTFSSDLLFTGMKILCFFLFYSIIFILVRKHSVFVKLSEQISIMRPAFTRFAVVKN